MSDEYIRLLERKLDASNDPIIALRLFYARKRAGDSLAGSKWYEWKMYAENKDEDLRDPDSLVYWVDGQVYCDECGHSEAIGMIAPTSYVYGHPYDPSYEFDEILDSEARSQYGRNLYALLGINEHWNKTLFGQGHPDDEWRCFNDCGVILKLDTHDIGWQDAMFDERPKPKKRKKKRPKR